MTTDDRDIKWSGKSRGGAWGHLFFIWLIKTFGVRSAYAFLIIVVPYFVPFAPKATKAIWKYYRKVVGQGRLKAGCSIFSHYYLFGQTIIDKVAVSNGLKNRFRFEFDNYEEFLETLGTSEGVVMIGAHVGCWEMGSSFFGDYASRLNVVMYEGEHQKIKDALERNSKSTLVSVVAVNEGGIESLLRMKSVLDRGEYLCFQGDRYMPGTATFEAEFMGHKAFFPQGPFVIGAKFKIPIVFYYATRKRGGIYRFEFSLASNGARTAPRKVLAEYTASLEGVLRRDPRQWFNFYDFWSSSERGRKNEQ